MGCAIANEVGPGIVCHLLDHCIASSVPSVDCSTAEACQRHRLAADFVLLRSPLSRNRCRKPQTRHDQVVLSGCLDEPAVESNAVTVGSRHGFGLLVQTFHAERSANGSSTSSGNPR